MRELSMSPQRAAGVRLAVRSNAASALEMLARQALASRSFREVKRLVSGLEIAPPSPDSPKTA